jgi:3-methyladenine DNA glycosylase AlkD
MIKQGLKRLGNPDKAKTLANFFKTGKDQYGEGDKFYGVTVPQTRAVAKKYTNLSLDKIAELLKDEYHEVRLAALLILVEQYQNADTKGKKEIFNFYWKNAKAVNNWDFVDLTAPKIVGDFLLDKPRDILYAMAKSDNLWEKRIAIISTFTFIRNNDFEDTLKIGEMLLSDNHDLIHKAVGWMLRELGKKNQQAEEQFLKKHHKHMPRTMLRYAIERFDKKKKEYYMKKDIVN